MTPRAVLACALIAVALAGCARGERRPSPTETRPPVTTTVPATTTTTVTVAEATSRFRDCLTASGVTIEEIPFDSQGRPRLELALTAVDFTDPASVAALTDCSEHLGGGALDLAAWPALQEEVQRSLTSFSECIRSHGVMTFPDPIRGFTGVGGPYPLDEIPFDDPNLETAVRICSARMAGTAS